MQVLVFGEIFDSKFPDAATAVLDAWVVGGWNKARNLEGCFSSVILDRTDGVVVLIGDLTGRRALSYFHNNKSLLVSPHDVALMSTGCIPLEYDEVSVGSVVAVEWSLRGRSLLKHVKTCHPAEYLRWSDGKIQHLVDAVVEPAQRISPMDSNAISRHLDHMIKTGQANARIFIADKPEIKCDLSAGLDSRVTWSLLLSVFGEPSQIIANELWGS